MLGIEQAKPGNHMGDVAHAIQSHAERHRYSVVRDFCGHGLGQMFHDAPEVVHAGRPGTGPELRPGMRSEEHTSELQSLMRISYAVFCLKKKTNNNII